MGGPRLDDEDADDSCFEQIMVASFPGGMPPQVYMVNLQAMRGSVSFQEAKVGGEDSARLSLGRERDIDLQKAAAVTESDQGLVVVGQDRKPMVLMYLDTAEEKTTWKEALQLVIDQFRECAPTGVQAGDRAAEEDDEINMLRARSQQQQTRIGQLEAVHKRRDKQLVALLNRLDGAMQMLDAVQDMCTQQRKVIESQRVAITELSTECGLEGEDETEAAPFSASAHKVRTEPSEELPSSQTRSVQAAGARAALQSQQPQANGSAEPSVEEVEAEMAAKAEQMLSLLKQADEMQQALQQLEASGLLAEGTSSQESSPERLPATEAEDEDPEAVLERLEALEAEKTRFEAMLSSSQNEQQELLQQLAGMRSLLSAAGVEMSDEESP